MLDIALNQFAESRQAASRTQHSDSQERPPVLPWSKRTIHLPAFLALPILVHTCNVPSVLHAVCPSFRDPILV